MNGTRNGNGGKNQPVDERSRCAALSLLAELWLLMDVSVTDGDEKKRAEVMKAILGLLKRAARETASVTGKIYIFETRKMNFVFTCWFFVFTFFFCSFNV